MAEVNAKDLTTKTTPASTDSMLLFGTTSNEGATKTFANQVGGSSAATLLAQLSTLNSNLSPLVISDPGSDYTWITAFKKAITDGRFSAGVPRYGSWTRGGTYIFYGYTYSNNNYGCFLLMTPSNFYHYWIEAGVHKYRVLNGGTWTEVT